MLPFVVLWLVIILNKLLGFLAASKICRFNSLFCALRPLNSVTSKLNGSLFEHYSLTLTCCHHWRFSHIYQRRSDKFHLSWKLLLNILFLFNTWTQTLKSVLIFLHLWIWWQIEFFNSRDFLFPFDRIYFLKHFYKSLLVLKTILIFNRE